MPSKSAKISFHNNYSQFIKFYNINNSCLQMKTQQIYDGIQVLHKIVYTNQTTLIQVIESIFDDVTIYNDKKIRQLIEQSPKGFIDVDQLANLPIFVSFVQKNPSVLVTPDEIIKCVQENSRKLMAIDYRIRRIQPFVDKIKNKKLTPIYVDKLPQKSTDEICEYFKNIVGVVYQIYHKKIQRWAIIVIDNYQILQPMRDKLYLDGQKITVLNPIDTLVSYGDNQRLNSDFNIVKLYENKNMWEFPEEENNEDHQDEQNFIRNSRRNQIRNRQERNQMNQMDQFDDDQEWHMRLRGKKQKISHQKHESAFRQEQLQHRIRNLEMQRRLKFEIKNIKNFDNTPLLQLRNQNVMRQ